MTNEIQVALMVLWSTNTMDTFLTPVGDDIIRSTIAVKTRVISFPDGESVTNTVPVLTNSVHLRRAWMDVSHEFPPVQELPRFDDEERMNVRASGKGMLADMAAHDLTNLLAVAEPPTNTASTSGGFRSTIELAWDYDTNSVPDVFTIYTSTNLSIPLTNWTPVATVSGTIHSATISNISPIQASFYVTAKNWWGETGPSNVAGTPPIPSDVYNLRIGP